MRAIDESVQKQVGQLMNELLELQLNQEPPALTNAETPADEQELEDKFGALCEEHGIDEKEIEAIADRYSNI